MKKNLFLCAGIIAALTLTACQSFGRSKDASPNAQQVQQALPLSTSIVFQADLVGCKRSVVNLYRQTGPADFDPVDRLVFVNKAVKGDEQDAYDARRRSAKTHIRAMIPGKYHIRSISCGKRAPRNEFAIGSFDVIEGRVAYIGKLVIGKDDGRVLLRVDNESKAAYEAIAAEHSELIRGYGVRLLVSNLPDTR